MPEYTFSCGNSTKGPVAFSARVTAKNKKEALGLLKERLPEVFTLDFWQVQPAMSPKEFVQIYFGVNNITVDNITQVRK